MLAQLAQTVAEAISYMQSALGQASRDGRWQCEASEALDSAETIQFGHRHPAAREMHLMGWPGS